MIAKIQLKGNATEVLVDEVDTISLKEPKKWFASPEWRTFDKEVVADGDCAWHKGADILLTLTTQVSPVV
jgi:hypothetical protein